MNHHEHEMIDAGRDFVEHCACGAIRLVGYKEWRVKEQPDKVLQRITCKAKPVYNSKENEQVLCVGHALEWLNRNHVVSYLTIKIDHYFCDMYSSEKVAE